MTRNGLPIQEISLKSKLDTGIEIEDVPGMVPRFYEMSACNDANYRFYGDWQELSKEQREDIVAHFILRHIIDGHKDEVVSQEFERKSHSKKG